jgi:hypothetical protein
VRPVHDERVELKMGNGIPQKRGKVKGKRTRRPRLLGQSREEKNDADLGA